MGERYFENEMPDMVEEVDMNVASKDGEADDAEDGEADPLLKKLLSLPYSAVSERLKRAGLDLKDTVVDETWRAPGGHVDNFILYSGTLGTAFLLFKSYMVTKNKEDLHLCSEIVKACAIASRGTRDGSFVCGKAGVFALGAHAAKHMGDDKLMQYYLSEFKQIDLPDDLPDEVLYGRAGYLWACLYINKHIHEEAISSEHMGGIVDEIIKSGRKLGSKRRCPLMFEKYNERQWGAANGLAGISHVLMHCKLSPDQVDDIKGTLKYMIKYQVPDGKYNVDQENNTDCLVHWCHGTPGVAMTLVKAVEVFGDREFIEAAKNASDVVWKEGLVRHVGICHGISGNVYVFLALYRLTGDKKYLYRAKAFACFLVDKAHRLVIEGQMDASENPYSLFEGFGGLSYLFLDMSRPTDARFPGYEL